MPLTIRPLSAEDRPEWGALWCEYLAFYDTRLSDDVYTATFERLLGAPPQHGLIAHQDGRAVGLAHYIFHAHNWHLAPVCYLQDLYTCAAHRKQGVGQALIEAVYSAADAAGAADTYWMTQDFNAPARRLYDRIGQLTPFVKYTRGCRS